MRASEVGLSRADDRDILQKSILDSRVLITLDAHFGDWAVLPLSHHNGVIRVKVLPTTSDNILEILIPFLRDYDQENFSDCLVILSKHKVKWISTAS